LKAGGIEFVGAPSNRPAPGYSTESRSRPLALGITAGPPSETIESLMQSLEPTLSSGVADPPSATSSVLKRVVSIAPAPLLPGESEGGYAEVALRIVKAAQPRDAIEEFLTRDVIELTWDILGLRRMKAGLLRATVGDGVRRILSKIEDVDHDYDERRNADLYAQDWARGIVSVRRGFAGMLKKASLTMDYVLAEAFAKEIDSFERFDRMLASAEARRNNALREIARHRSALGAAARQVVDEVEDAEFRTVETGELIGGKPS
jgi:hypothetical protein